MPKFQPTKNFSLVDVDKGRFNKDSEFISGLVREHINVGGVVCQILLMEGTFAQSGNKQSSLSGPQPDRNNLESFLGIQDTILLEARDRKYSLDYVPVKGVYTVSQNELEYARFGFALANDVLTMEFHIQEIEKQCGRRLIPGDVIELPHLREVDLQGRVANKWYEVSSVVKSPKGYDPMYGFHVLGCVLKPARNQQELFDIMNRKDEYGKTLAEQASTLDAQMQITEFNQKLAEQQVSTTWWDNSLMYFDPKDQRMLPERHTDDGQPPNGIPVDTGYEFPPNPKDYDYFVRSDLLPNVLFQFYSGRWRRKEVDIKREWQPYNWTAKLREFMSDHSDADNARGWELRSIHDVLTERQDISNPSPKV